MSLAEIKREVEKLGAEEVAYLSAYLFHLSRRKQPEYIAGLTTSLQAMEAGDRVSLAEYHEITARLRRGES